MKGLIKSFFVFVFIGSLCAAPLFGGGRREKSSGTGGVNVVAVNFPAYDFVRAVAGDRVSLTMLLPPGAESHSYEPSPRDIRTIQRADIFIYTGGESDEWVDGILESMDTGKMRILRLMDCVEVVEEEIVEGMQEEEEEEEGIAYDEHVWTSPQNAALIVGRIAGLLGEADGTNKSVYEENAGAYKEKLEALDASFKAVAGGGVRNTIVFGDRFPFRYFADAYGLDYFAAFPGCSTETECSAATIAYLIDKVKAEGIPVVFHIELANEGIADTICEATGAKKLLLHACHNVSKRDFEDGKTYLDFMTANVDALGEALRQ